MAIHRWGLTRLLDVKSGKDLPLQPPLQAHERGVCCVSFFPDGETVVSSAVDGTVRIWDARTGRQRQMLTQTHPKMRLWLSGGGMGVGFAQRFQHFARVALSPNGKTLAGVFGDPRLDGVGGVGAIFSLWDVATGRMLRTIDIRLDDHVNMPFFSPDGRILAVNGKHVGGIWETNTGKRLDWQLRDARYMSFALDGKALVASRWVKGRTYITFVDVSTGKQCGEIDVSGAAGDAGVNSCAISPDGATLAFASNAGMIGLWPLVWRNSPLQVVAGLPWEIVHGKAGESGGSPSLLTFSPDGRLLAYVKDFVIYLIETATGGLRARLSGHADNVCAIAFSADGARLVSGSDDTSLLIWDVTGRLQEDGRLRAARPSRQELEELWQDLAGTDFEAMQGVAAAEVESKRAWEAYNKALKRPGAAEEEQRKLREEAMAASAKEEKKAKAASALGSKVGRAVWELAAAGPLAVAFLEKRLQPVSAAALPEKASQWIADLDSTDFKIRQKARAALTKRAAASAPLIREALSKETSLEQRRFLQELLSTFEQARQAPLLADDVRDLRAIEVLGHIGGKAVRNLLHQLAAGDFRACQTHAAQTALEHLQRQQKEKIDAARKFEGF